MVSIKKLLQSNTINKLQLQLEAILKTTLKPKSRLIVGLSGGLDSCVLLHLLSGLRSKLQYDLTAVHVHHGLSPNADSWAAFCKQICTVLSVSLQVERVLVDKKSGLGLEASARLVRYEVLNKVLAQHQADYIVLAHHQNDQAETLLLQLFRGSGVKGLSSMAMHDELRQIFRPLLDVTKTDLETYAEAHQLKWIEDESNLDVHYDRNYCRHQILPVITAQFSAVNANIARSAHHMAEASKLLDELAAQDFGFNPDNTQSLALNSLAKLSESRARNLLRWWLMQHHQPLPSTVRLQEMMQQLLSAKNDASIKVAINSSQGVWLRRYQGMAYIQMNAVNQTIAMTWQGESDLMMPDGSRLIFTRVTGSGLAINRLGIKTLRIASRKGGERFKPDLKKPTRTLKHLLQEANMPPWERECLPLVYADDTLALVPNIGVACEMQASQSEYGLSVSWLIATKGFL